MLPLFLSIEGLYSYQEKQVIDFTKLTEAGLFGIFGSVGSGKSSILEAISFAIYGDTERLNKTDKRAYNMMNLKSNQTIIVFDFLNFENRKFRFTAQWRRRKNFEDTTAIERTAYEWINEKWIPLESANGAKVTNLSYPNFRRTIIIPQGQFKEFLELKGKDRSEMMKEIFLLNKFDLGPQVSHFQNSNNKKLENLKGALSGFESISNESLNEKKEEVQRAKENLLETKNAHLALSSKLKLVQEFKVKQIEAKQKEFEYGDLSKRKEKIKEQENKLIQYERTSTTFREPLNQIQSLNIEKESLIHKIENFQITKEKQSKEIDNLEKEYTTIVAEFNTLNILRAKSEDFKHIQKVKENDLKITSLKERLFKGQPYLDRTKQAEENTQLELAQTEKQLEDLKLEKIDTTQLIEMEKWYQKKETFLENQRRLLKQSEQIQAEIEEAQLLFAQLHYNESDWEESIANQIGGLEIEEINHREQETQLKVQVKLGHFATELNDGHPCPLCGALHHPNPMVSQQIHQELQANEQQKKDLDKKWKEIQDIKDKFSKTNHFLQGKRTSLANLTEDLNGINKNLQTHSTLFNWPGYSLDDSSAFDAQKQKIKSIEKQTSDFETKIKELRIQLQKNKDNFEKFQKELNSIQTEIDVIQAVSNHSETALQQLSLADYQQSSIEQVRENKQELDIRITYIETTYTTLTQKINSFKNKLAEVVGQYSAAKDQLSIYNQQLKIRQENLAKLLKEFNFNDIIEVYQIIQIPIPVEKIRLEIQQFHVRMEVLENQISSLKDFLNNRNFTDDEIQTTADLFELKEEELELQLSLTGGLEKELLHLTLEVGKKEKLLMQFEEVSNRGSNLKVLENLFKGNGFVNYVSSIHLKQMCEMANNRFHRLTRNQLSLTINENNEFEVIDFLNNGYRRSVKTLSGGQGFQASLCLALALAENIQVLNKSEKNFFFIDEGFGTQDSESINTVFDTLQYLYKENRIVGIISHVDELKERIPRSVTVFNDAESGSEIRPS